MVDRGREPAVEPAVEPAAVRFGLFELFSGYSNSKIMSNVNLNSSLRLAI